MKTDLVIVGAGPAGVSAALWAHTFRLATRLVERAPRVGGQLELVHFHPLEMPGVALGTGPEIAQAFATQLADARIVAECGVEAAGIEALPDGVAIATAAGARIEARAALVATGLRRRRLGVPGETEFVDRGVSYSARRDRERFAGGEVIVVGGGDGAFENALLLREVDCRVLLLVRDRARARPEFRARVAADAHIEVLEGARVESVTGEAGGALQGVRITHRGATFERAARGLVIKIGMIPNAEWCGAMIRDAEGYLETDARGRTSLGRVWAAGDVARPLLPSIAVAVGSAATALADLRAVLRGV